MSKIISSRYQLYNNIAQSTVSGQPSYEKRRFPVASFKTPEPITNKELPNTLKLVGAKNREICQYVVDFDPAKRSSASLWPEQLAKYGPVDGS